MLLNEIKALQEKINKNKAIMGKKMQEVADKMEVIARKYITKAIDIEVGHYVAIDTDWLGFEIILTFDTEVFGKVHICVEDEKEVTWQSYRRDLTESIEKIASECEELEI